tara:strand:- start:289 stop:414 length:126 start_codon:yes stop_codon:yes gene_type:complete
MSEIKKLEAMLEGALAEGEMVDASIYRRLLDRELAKAQEEE